MISDKIKQNIIKDHEDMMRNNDDEILFKLRELQQVREELKRLKYRKMSVYNKLAIKYDVNKRTIMKIVNEEE